MPHDLERVLTFIVRAAFGCAAAKQWCEVWLWSHTQSLSTNILKFFFCVACCCGLSLVLAWVMADLVVTVISLSPSSTQWSRARSTLCPFLSALGGNLKWTCKQNRTKSSKTWLCKQTWLCKVCSLALLETCQVYCLLAGREEET